MNKPTDHPNHTDESFLKSVFENSDNVDYQEGFPLVEPPTQLCEKLYRISDSTPSRSLPWRRITAVAASIMMVATLLHFNEKRIQYNQAVKASQDLALAFYYLDQTNRYASQKLAATLHSNLKKATSAPVYASLSSLHIQRH